jgi:hypothetical protein
VACVALTGATVAWPFDALAQAEAPQEAGKKVMATGEAALNGSDESLARDRAIKVAFRNAIEKGLGSFVSASTTVSNFDEIQDQISARAEGYVLGYDVVREWKTADTFHVQISAQVGMDKIKADFASLAKRVASQLGNPSIAFILTTWERGQKQGDANIIDAFQEEFLSKGFDLKATDKARQAAIGNDEGGLAIDLTDREVAKRFGAEEGANYVGRGRVEILQTNFDAATGAYVAVSKIGVEIIDASTGDIVGAYANTVNTVASSIAEAKAQTIKKNAVVAARTLASHTVTKWQDRANNGRVFTLVIRNVRSPRQQERPLKQQLSSFAEIRHARLDGSTGVLTMDVLFRGTPEQLEEQLYKRLDSNPVFKTLDKESQNGNTLTFKL